MSRLAPSYRRQLPVSASPEPRARRLYSPQPMTRFSRFLMALLLGLSLTSLSACEDPVDNGDEDMTVAKLDGGLDLLQKD